MSSLSLRTQVFPGNDIKNKMLQNNTQMFYVFSYLVDNFHCFCPQIQCPTPHHSNSHHFLFGEASVCETLLQKVCLHFSEAFGSPLFCSQLMVASVFRAASVARPEPSWRLQGVLGLAREPTYKLRNSAKTKRRNIVKFTDLS